MGLLDNHPLPHDSFITHLETIIPPISLRIEKITQYYKSDELLLHKFCFHIVYKLGFTSHESQIGLKFYLVDHMKIWGLLD
jgi:hypothetical protein